jgi:glucosamine-6-phosphate deaminase
MGFEKPIDDYTVDTLRVAVHSGRRELGRHAASVAAAEIGAAIDEKGEAVVFFASAPSQADMLEALIADKTIDWSKVVGLHVDEYIGAAQDDPHSFRHFLVERVFTRIQLKMFHGIHGEAEDSEAECRRYTGILKQYPADVALLGIGENGHLAFNDPPIAKFDDPVDVKIVDLEVPCRQQQVNDGAFDRLEDVPTRAITVTIPGMLRSKCVVVSVPGPTKAAAVKVVLTGEISEACPATALRNHADAHVFLDRDSAALLSR